MRLSIKWKLFYAANIFLFALVSIAIIASCYSINKYGVDDSLDLLATIALELGLVSMIFNYCLNLFMIHKYFPDTLVPVGVKRLNRTIFSFNILCWILVFLVFYFGFKEEFSSRTTEPETASIMVLVILGISLIAKAFVLVLQIKLPGITTRNNKVKMNLLIESLGDKN